MSHPLETQLGDLRRRARWLAAATGLSWTVAVVVAVAAALATLDYAAYCWQAAVHRHAGDAAPLGMLQYAAYLGRFQAPGLRLLAAMALWGVAGWAAFRFVALPLSRELTNVALARRLERCYPGLRGRLTSAVEFARQAEDDPLAGSAALRRTVIAETLAESQRADFRAVLDARPVRRAALVALLTGLLAAALVAAAPSAAQTALARLLNPFGPAAWPRQTELVLAKAPTRLARGQPFEVELTAAEGTRLPTDGRIFYRFENDDGTVAHESDALRALGTVLVGRRENVQRSFAFRVEGGDDRTMPWTEVEVVAPPQIASLRLRLTPPAYTAWPPQQSEGELRALAGTRVALEAAANKPLATAVLHWGEDTIACRLSDDGLRLSAPAANAAELIVEKSGVYWFELTDRDGLQSGREQRWEVRADADAPPSVVVEEPAANLFVTPQAVVPLRVAVKDDLAIHEVRLSYTRSDRPGAAEAVVPLYTGPAQATPPPADAPRPEGQQQTIERRWDLADLELAPGVEIMLSAVASDYRPQTARSDPRRLTVISAQELQDRLAAREGVIRAELERVLKMQRSCREQVETVRAGLAATRRVGQADVDRLQAAELNQRQVYAGLTGRGEGLHALVVGLLTELANNRVDSPELVRRLETILAELERLGRERLPLAGRELTAAIKAAQVHLHEAPQAEPDAALAAALTAAQTHQDAVIAALEGLLGGLAEGDRARRFHRELGQLLRDQQDLNRRTAETGRRTLLRPLAELTPQEAADLRLLAGQQLDLSRRLDRLVAEMDRAAAELAAREPLTAEGLREAADEAARQATSGAMRACGANLQQNQLGEAVQRQQAIVVQLQELLDILANRRRQELDRLMRKLQESEAELAGVEQQQGELERQFAAAAANADEAQRCEELRRLAERQQQLQQQAERLARQLERLTAAQPGKTVQQAAGAMGAAGQCAGGGDAAGARRNAAAAKKDLAAARRELARQRAQAQAELAAEQIAKLDDALKHLRQQQQNALDDAKRYEALRDARGELTRAQLAGLADLARLQRGLQTDAAAMAEKLQQAAALQLALGGAARDMDAAAGRLDRRQTDAATQALQQAALERLDMLVEALKADPPSAEPDDGGAGQRGGPQSPQGGLHSLAELKMLKLLQQYVNRRTAALQRAMAAAPTDAQRRALEDLAAEQSRLSELVLQLLPPAEEEPEVGPDDAPMDDRDGESHQIMFAADDLQERLERELGDAATAEDAHPLLRIARRMDSAGRMLGGHDAGSGTQKLQAEIVADLDRLIEQAKKACRSGQGGGQPTGDRPGGGPPRGAPTGNRPNDNRPQANSPRTTSHPPRKTDPAQVLELMKQVWGGLPPRLREQVMQLPAEEFMPKYESLIEDYFRGLAEERR